MAATDPSSDPLASVDSVDAYCICLPERRAHADAFFEALGLTPNVIFSPIAWKEDLDKDALLRDGVIDAAGAAMRLGEIACALSHRNAPPTSSTSAVVWHAMRSERGAEAPRGSRYCPVPYPLASEGLRFR